jgi:hypothetical protein
MSERPTRAVPAAIQEHNWNLKTGVENESVVNAFRRICGRGRWQWRSSTAYFLSIKVVIVSSVSGAQLRARLIYIADTLKNVSSKVHHFRAENAETRTNQTN